MNVGNVDSTGLGSNIDTEKPAKMDLLMRSDSEMTHQSKLSCLSTTLDADIFIM